MKKTIFTYILMLTSMIVYGQKNKKAVDPTLTIYRTLISETANIKDSLAIYALNFELSISKKGKTTVVTDISANDSLAFKIFPSYKKLFNINFSPLMNTKSKIKLIVPILIYGSSPEKVMYKDKDGNSLISLNAAVNAAYALYNTSKYNNQRDGNVLPDHLLFKSSNDKKQKVGFSEVMIIEPIVITLLNIK